ADTRAQAAEFLVEEGAAEAAMKWADGPEPKLCIARAKALLADGRMGEAAEAYKAGLAGDPSLKDADLDDALAARQASAHGNVVNLRGRPVDTEAPVNRTGR